MRDSSGRIQQKVVAAALARTSSEQRAAARVRSRLLVVGLVLWCLLAPSVAPAQVTEIVVEVENVVPGAAVLVALFAAKQSWLDDGAAVRKAVLTPEPGESSVRWTIDYLPEGAYAARAYQDLDGDRTLDKNRIGLPTEPFGFSNDAKPRIGPPGWKRARFTVPTARVVRFELRGGWKKAEEIAQAFERKFGRVEPQAEHDSVTGETGRDVETDGQSEEALASDSARSESAPAANPPSENPDRH